MAPRSLSVGSGIWNRLFQGVLLALALGATACAALLVAAGEAGTGVAVGLAGWFVYLAVRLRRTRRQLDRVRQVAELAVSRPQLADPETGLPNLMAFEEHLRREIARSLRYGDRTVLAVFDVRVVGFKPTRDQPAPPSPAPFIVETFRRSVRESDIIARLSLTRFGVLLTESDAIGGEALISRVRTFLAMEPYWREGPRAYYVRSWAGAVSWEPEYHEPALYLKAAFDEMDRTRPGYEAERNSFLGHRDTTLPPTALRPGA